MSSHPDSIWFRPPRARRGPRPTLAREDIVRAAIELADAEGLDAVSMRRIAAALGVGAASLYWYVSGKDDLHELMVDEAVGEIEVPEASGDYAADLRALGHAILAMLRRHPWMVLLGIRPVLGPRTRRFGELAPRIFDPLGLDAATRIQILATLNNYLYGFVHRERAWSHARRLSGLSETDYAERMREQVEAARERDPDFDEPWETAAPVASDDAFAFGLQCLIAGVAVRLGGGSPAARS